MTNIAVLLTVHNRAERTVTCLNSLFVAFEDSKFQLDVFLTDDGSTDGTETIICNTFPHKSISVLHADGNLYWNGGMINSWKAAISRKEYDGYLLLNNDVEIMPNLASELLAADNFSMDKFNKRGIYVGSVKSKDTGLFTYGGFSFTNKLSLSDRIVMPNGSFQTCQCAHANILFVSDSVVKQQGIFYEGYIHGGTDHDYTYLAYKAGFPIIVLREFVGFCENDHTSKGTLLDSSLSLKERIAYLKSPHGLNLSNTLLFQKRCFPWRLPFAWAMAYLKVLFPKLGNNIYRIVRR